MWTLKFICCKDSFQKERYNSGVNFCLMIMTHIWKAFNHFDYYISPRKKTNTYCYPQKLAYWKVLLYWAYFCMNRCISAMWDGSWFLQHVCTVFDLPSNNAPRILFSIWFRSGQFAIQTNTVMVIISRIATFRLPKSFSRFWKFSCQKQTRSECSTEEWTLAHWPTKTN